MMKKADLQIIGMHCASCSTLVQRALEKTEGVKSANVNLSSARATVEYDEEKATIDNLIESVRKRGYDAEYGKALVDPAELHIKEMKRLKSLLIIGIVFAVPSFLIGMLFMWIGIEIPYSQFILLALALPIQFYVGKEFYRGAWSALRNFSASMDTLIALGTSAAFFFSLYSIILNPSLGQYFETSTIIITLVILGKYLEARAKGKTSEAIGKLINLQPRTARVISAGKEKIIHADHVNKGDIIIVKPGEIIPVDGIIIEGNSSIDESMITGESISAEKKKGDRVFAATINRYGAFTFRAEKVGKDTTLNQIIKLVDEAQGRKAPIQRFADNISSYFVPIVILIAIITFVAWRFLFQSDTSFALIASVSVLVIACPCALGLATPTAIMVGTGKGAQKGILIKGGDALEASGKIDYVIFDKTGTITKGVPEVTEIIGFDTSDNELLKLAASVERNSEHPLAKSIVDYAKKRNIVITKAKDFKAIPGHGVEATVSNKKYFVGNEKYSDAKFSTKERSKIEELEENGNTVMIVASGMKILGAIAVADTIRESSKEAVSELKNMGIEVYMMTGDNKRTAKAIASQAGIENFFAEVLPAEKADYVKKLQQKGKVAMIGDGINDAPALAQADIGIAMSSGTDVAMESGNIVLMRNDPADVPKAFKLSRYTMKKIRQNMFWALFYNVLGIPIAAGILYPGFGILLSPVVAGAAMAASSVSVVSNSLLMKRFSL